MYILERKIRIIVLIKIVVFILLTRICHIRSDVRPLSKSMNEHFELDRKSETRNYRLLEKYKKDKDLNNLGRKKQSNRSILNKAQYYTELIDYNNGMFDGKHFHFEKKWIKKKDYDNFLENRKRIRHIALKKIKFKNYGFGVVLFFIFCFLGIGIPALPAISSLNISLSDIKDHYFWKHFEEFLKTMVPSEISSFINIILYSIIMVILSVIFIVAIYKILINNEKYNKIKLITEGNE
ncbi:uncharacterized protein MKS88_000250 [Plasmodium brasilianum]|uniref:uncharacterized protein n=1 Tax=Plasmodium brasilianum TaxID=5824 RepID=UPI00350E4B63|nr:hypothetical protein MKS88_000250 [Plasmodium brasilianum]